ncbi:MAG: hypothetical protein ACR2IQ_02700 [Minisyncoccia bacterium]
MEDKEITIYGRVPSKKNSRITTRSGRSFPSAKYTEWHKDASLQLIGKPKIETDYLEIHFYFPDNRRCDLTNKAESIMDLLVDNGLLEDDSWQVIPNLRLKFEAVDKDNPRCIIIW